MQDRQQEKVQKRINKASSYYGNKKYKKALFQYQAAEELINEELKKAGSLHLAREGERLNCRSKILLCRLKIHQLYYNEELEKAVLDLTKELTQAITDNKKNKDIWLGLSLENHLSELELLLKDFSYIYSIPNSQYYYAKAVLESETPADRAALEDALEVANLAKANYEKLSHELSQSYIQSTLALIEEIKKQIILVDQPQKKRLSGFKRLHKLREDNKNPVNLKKIKKEALVTDKGRHSFFHMPQAVSPLPPKPDDIFLATYPLLLEKTVRSQSRQEIGKLLLAMATYFDHALAHEKFMLTPIQYLYAYAMHISPSESAVQQHDEFCNKRAKTFLMFSSDYDFAFREQDLANQPQLVAIQAVQTFIKSLYSKLKSDDATTHLIYFLRQWLPTELEQKNECASNNFFALVKLIGDLIVQLEEKQEKDQLLQFS